MTRRSALVWAATFVTSIVVAPLSSQTDIAQSGYALVVFHSPAAARYEGGRDRIPATKPARGARLDSTSPAYRAYIRALEQDHAAFRAYLQTAAPQAEIVAEYFAVLNGVAVKLNGASAAALRAGPNVRAVTESAVYEPSMNISTSLIRADEVWTQLGGGDIAGTGVRVAVIDSGIDVSHPFFSDAGLADQSQIDRCDDQDNDPATPDTSNKVVVCRVFHSGVATGAPPRVTPELCNDHGTHVAGTIGGRFGTSGTVAGTDVVLTGLSGVAPGVLLGNYNVFPCIGAGFTGKDGEAFSHDIAQALEAAVLDGMHVANLSLGGKVQGPHDLLAEAADAAVDAGMVVVIAAGNEGPGDMTVSAPGSGEKVITAGASTNPHFIGVAISVAEGPTIGGAIGEFDPFSTPVTAPYTVTTPPNGCAAIGAVTGKIALIDRGACTFTTKIRNAHAAGAVGVLIVNNVAGDPVAMAHDDTDPFPTLPALMVGKAEGAAMKPSGTVAVDGSSPVEIVSSNADILAGFSSRGPTPFTYRIKPDLTAPGVNVASSVFGGKFAFFQGTSMATPHLSGVAALILAEYPTASPAEVKSRMANNAARVVTDHVTGAMDPGVLARGGGRVDTVEAFQATTWFDPVSVSFGLLRGSRPFHQSQTVAMHGAGATSASVEFAGPPPAGVVVTAAITGGKLMVTMSIARSVGSGDVSGDVVVTGTDARTYRVPFWVRVSR